MSFIIFLRKMQRKLLLELIKQKVWILTGQQIIFTGSTLEKKLLKFAEKMAGFVRPFIATAQINLEPLLWIQKMGNSINKQTNIQVFRPRVKDFFSIEMFCVPLFENIIFCYDITTNLFSQRQKSKQRVLMFYKVKITKIVLLHFLAFYYIFSALHYIKMAFLYQSECCNFVMYSFVALYLKQCQP